MKALVYAANLHVGGGIQVAASVIEELSKMGVEAREISVWASGAVNSNLEQIGTSTNAFLNYKVVNHKGIHAMWSREREILGKFDVILVIFGPAYFLLRSAPLVIGFAQPWIIYDSSEVYQLLSPLQRVTLRGKYWLQSKFFSLGHILLAELEHVRDGIVKRGIVPYDRVRIVRNCISSLYQYEEQWMPLKLPVQKNGYRLGFLGRNYVHKNTVIFPEVLKLLRNHYGIEVDMVVTFNEEEWSKCSQEFQANVSNIGPLALAQCPEFYRQIDAIVFPSLLECCSVTPLEAMAMKCAVFASDRPFVRDVCGEFADYFDPLNPFDLASVIANRLSMPRNEQWLAEAREHARGFSSAKQRAEDYLNCMKEVHSASNSGVEGSIHV